MLIYGRTILLEYLNASRMFSASKEKLFANEVSPMSTYLATELLFCYVNAGYFR